MKYTGSVFNGQMKKLIKPTAIIIASILIVGFIILFSIAATLSNRFAQTYKPITPKINIPTDTAALARGEMLSAALCTYCHGNDFSGNTIYNDNA